MVLAPRILSLPFVRGKIQPKNKSNPRSENMQKQRKTVKGDQIICLVSKHGQGHSVPSQGLWKYSEPYPMSCLVDTETPTRGRSQLQDD